MKKILLFLISILLWIPVLAEDLNPEPPDQAIKEYQSFWKTDTPSPGNHVIWKLYVFRAVPPSTLSTGALEYIVAGLTSYSRNSYYVGLRINQLYNYLTPIPQRGDVIVVSGSVTAHRHNTVLLPQKSRELNFLTLNLDGASVLKGEHFDPSTPVPGPATPTTSPH